MRDSSSSSLGEARLSCSGQHFNKLRPRTNQTEDPGTKVPSASRFDSTAKIRAGPRKRPFFELGDFFDCPDSCVLQKNTSSPGSKSRMGLCLELAARFNRCCACQLECARSASALSRAALSNSPDTFSHQQFGWQLLHSINHPTGFIRTSAEGMLHRTKTSNQIPLIESSDSSRQGFL